MALSTSDNLLIS